MRHLVRIAGGLSTPGVAILVLASRNWLVMRDWANTGVCQADASALMYHIASSDMLRPIHRHLDQHAHIHTCTYIHTYIHAYIHACIHAHKHICMVTEAMLQKSRPTPQDLLLQLGRFDEAEATCRKALEQHVPRRKLYHTILSCIILYYTVSYCIILYYTVLYCIILFSITSCCILLCYICDCYRRLVSFNQGHPFRSPLTESRQTRSGQC